VTFFQGKTEPAKVEENNEDLKEDKPGANVRKTRFSSSLAL
jgi:hypothetical protein